MPVHRLGFSQPLQQSSPSSTRIHSSEKLTVTAANYLPSSISKFSHQKHELDKSLNNLKASAHLEIDFDDYHHGSHQRHQGKRGEQGPRGEKGERGERGPRGEKGEKGDTTVISSTGSEVHTLTGAQGPTGSQGPKGADGDAGLAGPQGLAGPTGAPGAAGVDGIAGPQGLAGPTGAPGSAGIDGAVGPQGLAGPTGAPGAAGIDGAVGPQGPAGAAGIDGAVGPQGLTGATGADGIAGPTGPAGLSPVMNARKYTQISDDYTITEDDYFIEFGGTAAKTLTLSGTHAAGQILTLINISKVALTLAGDTVQNTNSTAVAKVMAGCFMLLIWNGTKWILLSHS